MIKQNVEGLADWNISIDYADRPLGVSAMLRVKDEAEYLDQALASIVDWCDEVVIALQGEQADGTDTIAEGWEVAHGHVFVHRYPFDSLPNGPGHGDQVRGSVYERAYFYNWTMSKTHFSHVLKWDGDMVALPKCGENLRDPIFRGIWGVRFKGVEIVDRDEMAISKRHPFANMETRLFPCKPEFYYETGPMCEFLANQKQIKNVYRYDRPQYLHFKWAKSERSATKAWPENWRDLPHFWNLYKRAEAGERYEGPVPECLL